MESLAGLGAEADATMAGMRRPRHHWGWTRANGRGETFAFELDARTHAGVNRAAALRWAHRPVGSGRVHRVSGGQVGVEPGGVEHPPGAVVA